MTTQTAPTEARNMKRLYSVLMTDVATPSIADYAPLGEWLDLATKFYEAHKKGSAKEVKRFMASLQKSDNPTFRKLVTLTSTQEHQDTETPPVGTLLSEVQPEAIRWLWKGRLALGKMTMLDGDPGLGKSLITLDLAARISTGRPMPDGAPGVKGGVVLITPEDGLADTIQPRLARAGASLSNIVSISSVPVFNEDGEVLYPRPFTLPDDLPLLRSAIARVNAKLVVIDPLMSIMGNQNTYKDNEVRAILAPVQMLVEEMGAACLLVRHLTKGGGDNALYRGGGSIAFIGLARLGMLVTKDPMEEGKCVLAPIKANISKLGDNLTYSIVSDEEQGDDRPYIHWEGVNTNTIQELMSTPSKPGANRQEIKRILKEAARPMSPQEVWQTLQDEGADLELNNVTTTLYRMKQAKEVISPARGLYTVS